MTQPGAKLTTTQFRMLQRIPDEGLSLSALRRQGHNINAAAQIRALRTLIPLDLVVEVRGDGDDVRFEITDAGRRLLDEPSAR
jgi:hypothetical protein